MGKIIKYLLIGALGIGLVGTGISLYLYNKPHRNLANQKPDFIIDAQSLVTEYRLNEALANEKFLGKLLLVTGEVFAIESGMNGSLSYSLEDALFGVTCTINSEKAIELSSIGIDIKPGDEVSFKGRCDGALTDVRISECVFIE